MATLTSAERSIPLSRRPDLVVQPLEVAGWRCWAIKDPLSLRYFQLREEEYFLLQNLDGRVGLDELKERFERHFKPRKLSTAQLQGFLGRLHHEGLLLSDSADQGEQLLKRSREAARKDFWGRISNVFAIRFRGIDPDWILNGLYPLIRWVFHPLALLAWLCLVASALALVGVEWQIFQARLPDFESFFSPRNALGLMLALALTKVLHELGHGLACKHFGGECHELGLMVLVFTPCLYCNVSDAWMLPSKWRRAAIGAAGLFVEFTIASVATWLWWLSDPGLLNSLCLNLMFICSAGTVLFNGNPLLRYDGYYILSDLAELPNLQDQSRQWLRTVLGRFLLGTDLAPERLKPHRWRGFLLFYAIAGACYRILIMVGIIWFLHQALAPYRLDVVARVLACLAIGMALWSGVRNVRQFVKDAAARRETHWGRFAFRSTLLGAAAAALLLIPLPYPLTAPVLIQPQGARFVFATVPGRLQSVVREGASIRRGEVIATLSDHSTDREVLRLRGETSRLRLQIDNLKVREVRDPQVAREREVTAESLRDVERRLAERVRDQAKLKLVAPIAGTVLPVVRRPSPAAPGDLRGWSGHVLDERNLGCHIAAATPICQVGNASRLEAVAFMDEADIQLIRQRQRVRLQIDEYPGRVLNGEIIELTDIRLDIAPIELTSKRDIPLEPDAAGQMRPKRALYRARIQLEQAGPVIPINSTGVAWIGVDPQPLAVHLYRYIAGTFRFEWADKRRGRS